MTVNSFKQKNMQLDMMVDLNVKSIATFSQGDRISDKLIINVSKDETIEDITGATSVRIDFKKPDGTLVFQNATVEDATKGIVSVILNTQTLAAPGDVQAEVTVNYTGGKSMVTRKFAFHVDEAIAGDTSLASSNDYPMLQKAIDLGDRMTAANVTPAQIVDAGALAANALPKAGGTMTGNIDFSNGNSLHWFNGASRLFQLFGDSSALSLTDVAGSQNIWSYNPSTKTFNVNSATNLYKKTDLYANYLAANGNTAVVPNGTDLNTLQASGYYGGTGLLNAPGGDTGYWYVETIRYGDTKYAKQTATKLTGGSGINIYVRRLNNNVWESWSQSIQADGGTMTGNLLMDASASNKYLGWKRADGKQHYIYGGDDVVGLFSEVSSKTPWRYTVSTDTFDINAANTNLVKKAGDKMTGDLTFDNNKAIIHKGNAGEDLFTGKAYTDNSYRFRDAKNNKDIFVYSATDNSFTLGANFKTAKDGISNLTLTGSATNIDATNIPPTAVRRGNTVTVRVAARRTTVNNDVVVTLPTDMRPVIPIYQTISATDGTASVLSVGTNGNLFLGDGQAGVPVQNKNFYVLITFTVD